MNTSRRASYIVGYIDPAAIAANYQCGHCHSDPARLTQDEHGVWHVAIAHGDGCPVLTGALSDVPDAVRAAVPATFRP